MILINNFFSYLLQIQAFYRLGNSKTENDDDEQLKELKKKFADIKLKLKEMERELPVENSAYLSIILGSNLNISLLNADDRYRYKQEYESFKLTVTYVILTMFFLAYMIPFRLGLF